MLELEPPLLFQDIGAKQKVLQRQRRKPSEHLRSREIFILDAPFSSEKIDGERERERKWRNAASRNKMGIIDIQKCQTHGFFFPTKMFPSNGSFHSAFAPQVKKYIQSCCWEVQAHQDQLRFQKRTSPRFFAHRNRNGW